MATESSMSACVGHLPLGRRSFRKQRTVNPPTAPTRHHFLYAPSRRPAKAPCSGCPRPAGPSRTRDASKASSTPSRSRRRARRRRWEEEGLVRSPGRTSQAMADPIGPRRSHPMYRSLASGCNELISCPFSNRGGRLRPAQQGVRVCPGTGPGEDAQSPTGRFAVDAEALVLARRLGLAGAEVRWAPSSVPAARCGCSSMGGACSSSLGNPVGGGQGSRRTAPALGRHPAGFRHG
jgi:hypothetical protein